VDAARSWIGTCRGAEVLDLEPLAGGAGRRRYWRASERGGSTSVLVQCAAEDPRILPPALRRVADVPLHRSPFVEITHLLEAEGIPVPQILGIDEDRAWLLLEDAGERHLLDLEPAERMRRYSELMPLVARVHAIAPSDATPFQRHFDAEWVGFELGLFLELVPKGRLREVAASAFAELAREIAALPRVLCLRDLQSQNVLIDAQGSLRLIDYQDALLAPPALDLAALLCDSYVDIARSDRARLLGEYASAGGATCDAAQLSLLTTQRKCKDFSRFRTLVNAGDEVPYAPAERRARASILDALPDLPDSQAVLRECLPEVLEACSA
jgi:aminoglycoside/choline kinase family phosphotransferase